MAAHTASIAVGERKWGRIDRACYEKYVLQARFLGHLSQRRNVDLIADIRLKTGALAHREGMRLGKLQALKLCRLGEQSLTYIAACRKNVGPRRRFRPKPFFQSSCRNECNLARPHFPKLTYHSV